MLNQVLKVSSGTCQQFVEDVVKISNIFWDFRLSQGSIATYCRCGGSLCDVYIENFLTNQICERILKIGPHLPKLLSNIKGLTFWGHNVYFAYLSSHHRVATPF